MKTSWRDIIMFGIGSIIGAFIYQLSKDVPNWQDATYSGFTAFNTLFWFGLFTQFFRKE